MKTSGWSAIRLSCIALATVGCGYSEEQWQAQLDQYARLAAQNDATKHRLDDTSHELRATQERAERLARELESMGIDLKKLGADLTTRTTELGRLSATQRELEAALAEYKRRADQLERIKQRFDQLRSKLEALTSLGLSVSIRNNRMMISLPGDVLFDAGKDTLRKDGQEILDKVAQIIRSDASLLSRQYQVAGHTDTTPLKGGTFRDNWGLSLMRARTVLLHLIDPTRGSLPEKRWSAAGFADTDPITENETPDGRAKNRRCELVVVPNAEEMLDLKNIAQ